MHRQFLYIVFAFLVGMLAGAFATGGQGPATDALNGNGQMPSPDVGERPVAADEVASPSVSASTVAAIGAASGELSASDVGSSGADTDLESRLLAMTAAWQGLQGEVARLQGRVEGLERRLAAVQSPSPAATASAGRADSDTPESRRSALVKAGVAQEKAEEIIWRQAQQELDQLELRDLAIREGWFASDRFREEMEQIRGDAIDLRSEIGADSYDRYLFATGEDNRVSIESIIPGSVADEAGLEPGDLVETYGDTRVFRFRDLRTATTEGDRGELVPVRIRRGDTVVDAWLPRGPLGVRLDRARVNPDN